MKNKKKIRNILIFLLLFIAIDILLTQLFLHNFYYVILEKRYYAELENRIPNKYYKYTFKKKTNYEANYFGISYTVKTNNLGFRDSEVKDLNKDNNYTMVIGDSFVEGAGLEYEDTLVGYLNEKIKTNDIKDYEFLNAGVTSYSSYIYQKKIINIIDENPWLKVDKVIVLLDKSDVVDDIRYFDRTEYFPVEKVEYNFKNPDFFEDLRKGDVWRFFYKQTITGFFLKEIGDILDMQRRNLRDRYKLSKKLKKSFFNISSNQVKAFRSINTRTFISNYFHGNLWEEKSKKSINFSIENLAELKNYLEEKNIEFWVLIYPWPFELVNKIQRENYVNYVTEGLMKEEINYISAYDPFLMDDVYLNITKNYLYQDIHFNKNGNKMLADIVWETLNYE
tara:strand:+ start:1536 stop:2714 length:1179 start_codon:yes stop_codon:yes gene_type:complete